MQPSLPYRHGRLGARADVVTVKRSWLEITLAIVVAATAIPGASADPPLLVDQFCQTPQNQGNVFAVGVSFVLGQVGPGGVGSVDVCLGNNRSLILHGTDAVLMHQPISSLDDGACFDFLRDKGHYMGVEDWTLRFHVHDASLMYIIFQDGHQNDCTNARLPGTASNIAVLPYHCKTHPDTMRANLVIRQDA